MAAPRRSLTVSPDECVQAEMEKRDWNQATLAAVLGYSPSKVSGLLSGKQRITPVIAVDLAAAFDTTTPEDWMRMENTYRLSKLPDKPPKVKVTEKQFQARVVQ